MKNIDRMLYELLFMNALEKRSLDLILDIKETSVSHLVQKAIRLGYIREKSTTYYHKRKRYSYSYLTLTSSGIKYIMSNQTMLEEERWLNDIHFSAGKIAILNTNNSSYSTKEDFRKFLNLSLSAMMAKAAGADVHPMYVDLLNYVGYKIYSYDQPEIESGWQSSDSSLQDSEGDETMEYIDDSPVKDTANSLSKIVISAYKANKEYSENHFASEREYVNAIELKHLALNVIENSKEVSTKERNSIISDVLRGRYSGLIKTQNRLLLMYVPPAHEMRWNQRLYDADKKSMVQYNKYLRSIDHSRSETVIFEGCLLVNNKEDFKKRFFDSLNARKDDDIIDKHNIGYGFDSFYIVPANKSGVEHLKWLCELRSSQEDKEYMINWCLKQGYDHLNKRIPGAGSLIRLYDRRDNTYAFYGAQMDIKDMYVIKATYDLNPGIRIKVLCDRTWQEEYYKALFPEIIT